MGLFRAEGLVANLGSGNGVCWGIGFEGYRESLTNQTERDNISFFIFSFILFYLF